MDIYYKVTAGILIAVILGLVLSKYSADISLLLVMCVCCMVIAGAVKYLQPVLEFMERLLNIGRISTDSFGILLKVTGIGMVSQIAEMICADAGNRSLAKALQIMTAAVILCISIPILDQMLVLIENILGEV